MAFLARSFLGLLALALPLPAAAQEVCPFGFLSCAPDLSAYIDQIIIRGPRGLLVAFGGILFAYLIFYGMRLAMGAPEEEAISQVRRAYTHAIYGTILVVGAYIIASGFVTGAGVAWEPLTGLALQIVRFFKLMVFALLVSNFFYQGLLLIVAMDDATRQRARKLMMHGMIATAIVILADTLVETATNRDMSIFSREAVGLANYVGTIFGFLAVMAIIVGGILLVISVEEQTKERAKQIIKAAIIAIAVVVSSYVLAITFVF